MGTDKALLEVDGEAMAVRVATALRDAGADEVRCIGGDASALERLGLDVVADDHPGEGPLGAVLTALRAGGGRVVLVAPCDHLAPDPATFAAVVAALAGDADVAVPVARGVRQPLNAAYAPRALDDLERAFAAGERSVRRAIDRLVAVEVPVDAAAVADADAPGDLPGGR